jgi:nitrite reductase/ring-hydroxylating ferredoxin subunit
VPRHRAGSSQEFPEGVLVAKTLDSHDLLFVRWQSTVLCFLDQCSHQPIKLSEFGEFKNGRLVCHAHGGVFDLDRKGEVVCLPPRQALTAFMCEELNGHVFVVT